MSMGITFEKIIMSSKGLIFLVLVLSFKLNLILASDSDEAKFRCDSLESLENFQLSKVNKISPNGVNEFHSPGTVSLASPPNDSSASLIVNHQFPDEDKVIPFEEDIVDDFIHEEYLIDRKLFKKTAKFDRTYNALSLPWTENDYLPAYEAALRSDLRALNFIKESFNIPLDKMDLKTGELPLHAAYRVGNHDEVIDYITLNTQNNLAPLSRYGMTPFHCAVAQGNHQLVARILRLSPMKQASFKMNLPDNEGRSPLMTAALNGNIEIFQMLKYATSQDYLKKDKRGRSLLSLLTPDNPIYGEIIRYLEKDMEKGRDGIVRKIAADISFLYRNTVADGRERALNILKRLGISLVEMIRVPQESSSNLLMAILDSKEYDLYIYLKNYINFDINAHNGRFEIISFFNACLQFASFKSIEYLFKNDNPRVSHDSIKIVIMNDRLKVLKLLESQADFIERDNDFELIVLAGLNMANKCFKHLLRKYLVDGEFPYKNLFCEAAIRICNNGDINSIKNIFDNFDTAMKTCSIHDILTMRSCFRESDRVSLSLIDHLSELLKKKVDERSAQYENFFN